MRPGAKPKPHHLKVIEGTARPDRQEMQEGRAINPPVRPKHIKGVAARIWDEMVSKHPQWTEFQFAVLESYCQLKAEHQAGAKDMPTARIVELRRQAELLLAPRGKSDPDDGKPKDPSAEFF